MLRQIIIRIRHLILSTLLLTCCLDMFGVHSELTNKPSHTMSREGDTTNLICRSNLSDPVSWTVISPGSTVSRTIYEGSGIIHESFLLKFSVLKDLDGYQNLIITNVSMEEAGTYTCMDEMGFGANDGRIASAELTVYASDLECVHNMSADGVLSRDLCNLGLRPDVIHFTCIVNFRGNMVPSLIWRKHGSEEEILESTKPKEIVLGNRVRSSLVFTAEDHMNGLQLACSVDCFSKISNTSLCNALDVYASLFPSIKILALSYNQTTTTAADFRAPLTKDCSVDTNLACQYEWINSHSGSIIYSKTLVVEIKVINVTETYRCSTRCLIRGKQCVVTVDTLNVTHATAGLDGQESHQVLILVLCSLAVLVFCGLLIFTVCWKCARCRSYGQHLRSIIFDKKQVDETELDEVKQLNGKTTNENREVLCDCHNAKLTNAPSVKHVLHTNKPILDLTILGTELFVVRGTKLGGVDVYDTNTFVLIRTIYVPSSTCLYRIVACVYHNCLYLADNEQSAIYRCDYKTGEFANWSVTGMCWGLSITLTNNLLVTLFDAQEIREYSTTGSLLHVINLRHLSKGPRHCVQMSSGDRFVVSLGDFGQDHRVSIIDSTGTVSGSFGGAFGSSSEQLNRPGRLAMYYDDQVLVVDWGNNRVLLFSRELTVIGCVYVPVWLKEPYALHFDKAEKRVYIGEYQENGHVFILHADGNLME